MNNMTVRKHELVVITGVTGHVGSAVLIEALQQGFNVLAVIREPSQEQFILSSNQIRNVLECRASMLSFATVLDITAPGTFDSVVEEATYIIHVASPLARPSMNSYQAQIIDPAVKGTVNVLHSALKCPSIKRIVITSSTSALVDGRSSTTAQGPFSPAHRQPNYEPEFYAQNSDHAYIAAKTAALNASDAFLVEEQPHFDVVNIMPGYVFGPKKLALSVKDILNGSNIFGIGVATRRGSWRDLEVEAVSCHIDDVAKAHVHALDLKRITPQPGSHHDFILAVPFVPDHVHSILREKVDRKWWQDADSEAPFGSKGCYKWYVLDYDVSATENMLLGSKLKGLQSQIENSASQIIQFLGNDN